MHGFQAGNGSTAPAAGAAVLQDSGADPLRILLLEDLPADAKLIERELHGAGFNFVVQRAGTQSRFVEALETFHPDILLCDYFLLDVAGRDVLAQMRRTHPEIPVVTFNGTPADARAITSGRVGVDGQVLQGNLACLLDAVRGAVSSIHCIRDREAAERALRTSEAQLSNALQLARAGHWTYDALAERFTFNDNFYRIFRTTAAEAGGYILSAIDYARRFCHPADADVVASEVRASNETSDPHYSRELEHRILYADGSTGWMAVRFFVEKDASGRTVRTHGVNQDITEHKRAEEGIREEKEKFRTLVEQNIVGVLIAGEDGRIGYINPFFAAFLGYTPPEATGRQFLDLVAESERSHISKMLSELSRSGVVQIESKALTRDGRQPDILVNASPGSFDGQSVAVLLVIDISERKRADTALHQSLELLHGIMDSIPIAVFWKDKNLRYLGANAQAARDAGYAAPEEMVGKEDHQMAWSENADRYRADDRQVIESGQRKLLIEEPMRNGSGEQVTLLTSKLPLRDADGEVDGVLGVYMDITERKKVELLMRVNRTLRTLSGSNEVMLHFEHEEDLYRETCRIIVEAAGYKMAWVGVPVEEQGQKIIKRVAGAGLDAGLSDIPTQSWGDSPRWAGLCGRVVNTGEPQVARDLLAEPCMAPWNAQAKALGFQSAAAFPLKDQAGVFAVLEVHSGNLDAFNVDELQLLRDLADRLGFGVRAARDRSERINLDRRWRASLEATVAAIARAVEARDPYTAGHEHRVAQLAVAIGQRLGMPEHEVHGLYLAGVIHDVGKITVPSDILNKPGKLTPAEFELIKAHAQAGYEIIQGVDFPWPIARMIQQHHERLDGSGYPQGLKGDAILKQARILAVADVVEAMMSHRPYRPALGLTAAISEIEKGANILFDGDVTAACAGLFREKGFSLT